jgi:aminoglycoside phosphotransferase family enzyme
MNRGVALLIHPSGDGDPGSPVPVESKVRFLSTPEAFGARAGQVEVVETHVSWVFLFGDRALKLKKPVRSDYFDFTSLAAREVNCRREVRLNGRLAGEVYLGVARLVRTASSRLAIDAEGETIDWLVVMRRLPADRMLDQVIARSAFGPTEMARLAERLADFYAAASPAAIAPRAYRDRFVREQAANRSILAATPDDGSSVPEHLLDRLEAALVRFGPLLEQRAREGQVVDGHGDLRPEHICMTEPIVIFDCLEFSDELRLVDVVDELAFLGLECAMLGAIRIGPELMGHVLGKLRQPVPNDLYYLYAACRALLRARQSLTHLLDPVVRDPDRWRPQAIRYMAVGEAALARLKL